MKKIVALAGALIAVLAVAAVIYRGAVLEKSVVTTEQTSVEVSVESSKASSSVSTSSSVELANSEDETEDPAADLDELSIVRRIRFEDAEGEVSVLSDYVGEPIVLNIWASWCEPCQREMPLFAEAMAEYDDVQFVMLNATGSNGIETKESADAFMASEGLDFPVVYDYRRLSQLNLGVTMLPTTLFIDAQGEIVYTQIGEVVDGQLQELIETYL